jgi:hypothetical protein
MLIKIGYPPLPNSFNPKQTCFSVLGGAAKPKQKNRKK